MGEKKKKVDYERIEAGWRAGILSPRELAAQYEKDTGDTVSHAAIIKHFKAKGIERDLAPKIRAKADALVTQSLVTEQVTPVTTISEREVVDANAKAIADIRLAHRSDIRRGRTTVMALLSELELQTGAENVALLEQLGVMMFSPNENGIDKLNELYHKIISLPGRAKTMKDLGETLRVLIGLEREAYGIAEKGSGSGGGEEDKPSKLMTDTERALRLTRLLSDNPDALALLGKV